MAQQGTIKLNLTTVDTATTGVQQYGQEYYDAKTGNTYIYLPGVASLAAADLVAYTKTVTSGVGVWTVSRMLTSTVGSIALALSAVTATTSGGWYLKSGSGTVKSADATLGGKVFATATAGTVSSTAGNDTLITGAVSLTATSSGTSTIYLDNAFYQNEVGTA